MTEFNLTREPWIPVEALDGSVFDLSTRDVLQRAHELRALADPSPLVVAALTRHLLAVLHRSYDGPRFMKEWGAIARAGAFAAVRVDALRVELRVDRVGAALVRMQLEPEGGEAVVVGAPAERARAMPGRERRRLVEKEELREAPGLHQSLAVPAAELEPARDPALPVEAAPDPPRSVVEAAAVTVDEPTRGIGDELPERRHTVL